MNTFTIDPFPVRSLLDVWFSEGSFNIKQQMGDNLSLISQHSFKYSPDIFPELNNFDPSFMNIRMCYIFRENDGLNGDVDILLSLENIEIIFQVEHRKLTVDVRSKKTKESYAIEPQGNLQTLFYNVIIFLKDFYMSRKLVDA
jgi:hypothetical protein